jgi:hypothetical protein
MKKINKNIDFVVKKSKWSNADGDSLEKQYGNPSANDAYFKSRATLYSTSFGQNDVIKNEIVKKAKQILSKYGSLTKLDIQGLKNVRQKTTDEWNASNGLESSAFSSLADKYDDIITSRDSAINIANRNIRDVEGNYPNINHKHANLIKNVLDHHITGIANESVGNYAEYLTKKAQSIEDEIDYAKEKNTYDAWKKLDGKGFLDSQKKVISDKIKELTPKANPQTGSKANTNATADELINGSNVTSNKKWIYIGAGGLILVTALYLLLRKNSSN